MFNTVAVVDAACKWAFERYPQGGRGGGALGGLSDSISQRDLYSLTDDSINRKVRCACVFVARLCTRF